MGCVAVEATDLVFVCFLVLNPRVLSANRVNFGLFFLFHKFLLPQSGVTLAPPEPTILTASGVTTAAEASFWSGKKKTDAFSKFAIEKGGGFKCVYYDRVIIYHIS